jgi:glycerate dehydrogenase
MKKNVIIINVGRGPVIDEKGLVKALNEGLIAGAGLDVLETEPLPADSPLLTIQDNTKLVITPHVGWASVESRQRSVDEVECNIEAFLNHKDRNIVG